jgi:Rhs element Vgr protein
MDGDLPKQEFPISESASFAPGTQVEIKLRYEETGQTDKTVFKGIVVKQGLQIDSNGGVLTAEMSDASIKMTTTRKSAVFVDMKDDAVIKKLISAHGLQAKVPATKTQHKKLVQYYASDWDFMLSRAEVNGLLVSANATGLTLIAPKMSGAAKMKFDFNRGDVYEFALEADARSQLKAVQSVAWDVKKQALTNPAKALPFALKQGDFDANKFATAMGAPNELLVAGIGLEVQEAQAWANAKLMRSRLSMYRGRIKIEGTAEIEVGDIIELGGVGARFAGKTIATAVRHIVSSGGWETHVQFGLDAEPFAAQSSIVDAKASGLVPGVNGLQIGVVTGLVDPDNENRIEVKIPAVDAQNGLVWARLAMPDAGNQRGILFRPEAADEVILGFLNDDPRQAIIIGSVFSSANKPPFKAEDKNPEKGIVTRSGMKVVFDDEKKTLMISTSADNVITINEQDKFVEIKDANNNTVKMSKDGIVMESGKDVIIKSKGDVKIQASGGVEIKGAKIDVI